MYRNISYIYPPSDPLLSAVRVCLTQGPVADGSCLISKLSHNLTARERSVQCDQINIMAPSLKARSNNIYHYYYIITILLSLEGNYGIYPSKVSLQSFFVNMIILNVNVSLASLPTNGKSAE